MISAHGAHYSRQVRNTSLPQSGAPARRHRQRFLRFGGAVPADLSVWFEKGDTMDQKQKKTDKPMEKARELSHFTAAKTDPMGSWTGQPIDPYEVPVQDADDL